MKSRLQRAWETALFRINLGLWARYQFAIDACYAFDILFFNALRGVLIVGMISLIAWVIGIVIPVYAQSVLPIQVAPAAVDASIIPTITLGNIITIFSMIVMFIVTWTRQDMRVKALEVWRDTHERWAQGQADKLVELRLDFEKHKAVAESFQGNVNDRENRENRDSRDSRTMRDADRLNSLKRGTE